MNSVGVALIGAGRWGTTLGRAVARVPGAELRWICEIDPERRSRAAEIHPRARLAESLDRVLQDPLVQAAVVAVDSPQHHSVGMQVLEADRHLLMEKPMALSTADAAELHAVAGTRKLVLAVGHLLLHHPAVQRARELVSSGVIGDPVYLEANRLSLGTGQPPRSAWWSLAPHDVSLALYLFQAVPSQVTAVGGAWRDGQESVAWATLRFGDGRLAHLHAARIGAEKRRQISVIGTRRTLTFDELSAEPLSLSETNGHSDRITFGTVDPLLSQCRHFVDSVARRDTTVGNGAHALAVVRVLEAGALSILRGGFPVEVE